MIKAFRISILLLFLIVTFHAGLIINPVSAQAKPNTKHQNNKNHAIDTLLSILKMKGYIVDEQTKDTNVLFRHSYFNSIDTTGTIWTSGLKNTDFKIFRLHKFSSINDSDNKYLTPVPNGVPTFARGLHIEEWDIRSADSTKTKNIFNKYQEIISCPEGFYVRYARRFGKSIIFIESDSHRPTKEFLETMQIVQGLK